MSRAIATPAASSSSRRPGTSTSCAFGSRQDGQGEAPSRRLDELAAGVAIASGSWLPLDLEGAEVRQRPVPCAIERVARRLAAARRTMRITDAATGATVYESTTEGTNR